MYLLSDLSCLIPTAGVGQTNLWMPQGVLGQVMIAGEQGYMVRWEHSYSSWTLFTCEVEMLLHVVSTAGTHLACPLPNKLIYLVNNESFILYNVNI